MPFFVSPIFRSPFTDLTSDITSHQLLGRCATQEMEYMDCLEAYGWDRGMRKKACKALFEEYKECHTRHKQFSRFMTFPFLQHYFDSPFRNISTHLKDYVDQVDQHTLDVDLAMRRERDRQIRSGKLQGDKTYVTPKIDSY